MPAQQPDLEFIKSQNWYEARPGDKNPERRAYHSSFIHNNKFYIYGGRDLSKGALSSLWVADLKAIDNIQKGFVNSDTSGWIWNEVQTSGPKNPSRISHHTSVVY